MLQPNLIPCPVTLAHTELGGRRVLPVEEWAEIRRLHRVEGLPIKVIARVMGGVTEHCALGDRVDCTAEV